MVPMPKAKPNPTPDTDDPAEYQRFLEIARELGVDESPDALDRAFEKVMQKRQKPQKETD